MAAETIPTFEEHLGLGRIGEVGLHADLEKLRSMVERIQQLETLEGVLAIHVDIARSVPDGTEVYLHHIRTKDFAARERALLAAHEVHGTHVFEHCDVAKELHGNVEEPRAKPHHSDFHKLSSFRLKEDFGGTAYVDWEAKPIGSTAAKFAAVRAFFIQHKEDTSEEVIAAELERLKGLPSKYPVIKQVSYGKNTAANHAHDQLYPDNMDIDWDVGLILAFDSSEDRAKLDTHPEFVEAFERLSTTLKRLEIYDIL